jgi:hypothetical protein
MYINRINRVLLAPRKTPRDEPQMDANRGRTWAQRRLVKSGSPPTTPPERLSLLQRSERPRTKILDLDLEKAGLNRSESPTALARMGRIRRRIQSYCRNKPLARGTLGGTAHLRRGNGLQDPLYLGHLERKERIFISNDDSGLHEEVCHKLAHAGRLSQVDRDLETEPVGIVLCPI